jgi:hypothetical protein
MEIRQMVQSNANSAFTWLGLKPGPSGGRMHGTGVFLVMKGLIGKYCGDDVTVQTVDMNTGNTSLAACVMKEHNCKCN